MARLALILALATGVTVAGAPITASAAPSTPSTPSKTSKTSKTGKTKKSGKSSAKQGKRGKRGKQQPRLRMNMPRGHDWPPTRAMRAAGKTCERQLDKLGVKWKRASREGRIAAPIVVPSMRLGGIQYVSGYRPAPHKMDCHLALVLEQIGPALHALGVRQVKFGSIYRWSNVRVNGTTKPFLSRHALGIAMDVVSLVDEQGRSVVVAKDYSAGDALLLGVEDAINRSGKFRTVLTPANDPASHDDHFHFEVAVDYGK